MIFHETTLPGAYIIDIEKIEDDRGFFGRSWCKQEFENHNLVNHFVQSNISYNKYRGTLRGMHYQLEPYGEVKIVRCTKGNIFDVIIDLRKDSPTYKQWIGIDLDSDNYKMIYIPENFAHGLITLSDDTEIVYLVSQFYSPKHEKGIRYDDPQFNISWPIDPVIISEKDQSWKPYQDDEDRFN